ncbi:hypothetical protein OIU85_007983 [Salix viminalis]|uniref:non-specific serine/threonine protein kinase n=1 Tax=Salix viminalis TaxID=40686 RepID=A0A9Q0SNY1_SALVM|nr:hypothetical protein OIU85_007983 [Salix viminalis]
MNLGTIFVSIAGSTNGTRPLWIGIGLLITMTAIIPSSIIIICLTRRKGSFRAVIAMAFRQKNSQHVDNVETFMMDYHSLTPKRPLKSTLPPYHHCLTNRHRGVGFPASQTPRRRRATLPPLPTCRSFGRSASNLISYPASCKDSIEVPVRQSALEQIINNPTVTQLQGGLNQGFGLEWKHKKTRKFSRREKRPTNGQYPTPQPLLIPPPMHPLTTTTSFLLTLLFLPSTSTTSSPSNDSNNLSNCSQTFSCGTLKNVTYPFTGGLRPSHCGPPEFGLTCDADSVTILKANSLSYRVTHLNHTSQTLRLSRSDFHDNSPCTLEHTNNTLNNSIFLIDPTLETLSLLYNCDNNSISSSGLTNNRFSCDIYGDTEEGFYVINSNPYNLYSTRWRKIECKTSIQVPILPSNGSSLGEVLKEGFDVSYVDPYSADCTRCYKKYPAGYCGFDAQLGKPICICNDQLCPGKQKSLVFMSLVKLTGEIDERRFLSNYIMLH